MISRAFAFVALASLTHILSAQTSVKYFQPGEVPLNCNPGLMAEADLNHDGIADLVIPCTNANSFLVLLADGGGGFRAPVTYVSNQPAAIAIGDLNGDGNLDLVLVGPTPSMTILFGKGDGTFPNSKTIGLGRAAQYAQVADVNGDGELDIVLGMATYFGRPNSLEVLLGNGNGTFQSAKTTVLKNPPTFIMAGDFNGDGKLDLALVENPGIYDLYPYITVTFGNGDGTFQPEIAPVIDGVYGTKFLVTGDFNKDGRTDIAGIVNSPSNTFGNSLVTIALGQANGSFTTSGTYSVENAAVTIATADLNGDGTLDLAVANGNSGTVTTLLGKGDGTLSGSRSYPAASAPYSVALGNFGPEG